MGFISSLRARSRSVGARNHINATTPFFMNQEKDKTMSEFANYCAFEVDDPRRFWADIREPISPLKP